MRQVEAAVHRAHHQVEPRQHCIRQVEAAVFEDVHLDALEQRDAVQFCVKAVDLVALARQLQRVESVRDGEAARMFGDGQVFQPQRLGRQRHVAQAVVAVGGFGVRMQVASEVGQFHQFWQSPGARRFDFAAIFAQLWRYVRQADGAIHRLLAVAGDATAVPEYAVLVDLEVALLRQPADRDIMRLAAGEIDQGRPITFRRNDPDVDLEPRAKQHSAARRPSRQHARHLRIAGETVDH